ncbi:MAG: tyrosinase, partial [Ottowia sp.]|nr:tyrosinase [Ottowia sp.]
AALIDDQVYAIGLGSADQINPVALTALTNGTGGYVLMTGALSTDDFFVLQKYYLQILAGVTNADIVLDPDGWLASGQKLRIPFRLSETDITADAILLTGSAPPDLFRFALETPDGAFVTPATAAALPDITYAAGARSLLYRMTLPLPVSGHEEREGLWHALLQLDEKVFKRYLASLDKDPKALAAARTHGVRYSLNVHASSNLSLRARLLQDSNQPGARLTVRATLTEYGLPVENRAAVALQLTRPDGSAALVNIAEIEPGIYEASTAAAQPGIHRFRVLASGRTLRGRPFT